MARLIDADAVLDVYKSSQDWKDQDGKYIPSAKNFLLNRYWEKPPKLSGQCSLGKAEFEAIQRILTEDYNNEGV